MSIGTFALLTVTGSLVLFKLGLMAVAVALLVRTLHPKNKPAASLPTPVSVPLANDKAR